MRLRSDPTTFAFATMPTAFLAAAIVLVTVGRGPLAAVTAVLGWAVWEGSVARELAAVAGTRQTAWETYWRALVLSAFAGVVFVLVVGLGYTGLDPVALANRVLTVGVRQRPPFVVVLSGLVLAVSHVLRVRFVGDALASAEAGEAAKGETWLAVLGLLVPPIWALAIHHRAREILLAAHAPLAPRAGETPGPDDA